MERLKRSLFAGIIGSATIVFTVFLWAFAVQAAPVPVVKTLDGSHILCKKLVAGQNIEIGTVCLEVVGDVLNVTYKITAPSWGISQTHFWAGQRVEDMPQNKAGNPVIGKFPYKSPTFTATPLPTTYTQAIPLLNLSFACPTDKDLNFYAAAHAAVVGPDPSNPSVLKGQTAWGDGDRIVTQGNWGMYFTFTLSCSNNEAQRRCETAFGVDWNYIYTDPPFGSSICFLDLDVQLDGAGNDVNVVFIPRSSPGNKPQGDFDRWGWSNGPMAKGDSREFAIYAGAGRCDLTKGQHVGTLFVEYSLLGMVTAKYVLFGTGGWGIDQIHLYVGPERLARDVNGDFTVAPGQYTLVKDHVEESLFDSTTLGPFEGNIYVVGHATVCTDL